MGLYNNKISICTIKCSTENQRGVPIVCTKSVLPEKSSALRNGTVAFSAS